MNVVNLAPTDELGVETLLGEFLETGTNHGKKFFKRVKAPNGEESPVFLYFWDERDGADFSGWWFGDQVGGSQVWSRCERSDPLPPTGGWRIPWDGPVRTNLAVKNETPTPPAKPPAKEEKISKAQAAAEAAKQKADEENRVQTALDRIVIAEIEATQALESSQAMLDGEVTKDALKVVEEMLQAQQTTMVEAHKTLAADIMEARKTAPGIVDALTKLTPRLRTVQASLAQEMAQAKQLFARKQLEAKDQKKQAVAQEKIAQAAKRDREALDELLPSIHESVEKAETAVEAAVGASGPLSSKDAEDSVVEAAITATEEAAVEAQKVIKVAKKAVNGQLNDAKAYAGETRKFAMKELTELQDRLTEAHKRLVPCIRVRKDYEQKLDARKVMGEVATKLGAVELEVEKVLASFEKGMPSDQEVKDAEESISPVMSSLANAMRFVDQRIKTAQGVLKEDLLQMQERGKESKMKLDGLRAKLRDQQEQTQVLSALQRALELTAAAEEACQKMADAEGPFLLGEDPAPGPEADKLIETCTEAAKKAEAASQKAAAFLKAKQGDSRRFPEEVRQTSIDELAQLQLRIEATTQQVDTFKRDTSARRTALLVREVSQKIDVTEAKVKQVVALAGNLASDKLEDMAVTRLKEQTDQTLAAEKVAGVSLAEARQALAAKQKHAEAKDSSASLGAELAKLTTRLLAAQQELSQQRKVAVAAERCWKGKRILEEKDEELKRTEAELEKLDIMTTPLGDERTSDETLMEIAAGVEAVEASLEKAVKSLEAAVASAQGVVKAGVTRLLARARKAEARLEDVKAATVEQRERASVDVILTGAKGKMASLDDCLQKISVAEVPFQGGAVIASMQLTDAKAAIADSEAAAIAMQEAVVQARTFLTSKSLEVRKFGEAAQRSGLTEISALSGKVEEHVKKLSEFRKATATRKRGVLDMEAAALVAEAEEAVQKTILAATPLATHNVDEMASDAAIKLVETLGEAEAEAQKQLNNAKKFVMARQREKRAQSEMDELAKLMGRLSSSQEDLTQAKTTASDHEQKVVSRSLLQKASDMITNLELEMDKAALAAVPLVEHGGRTFVASSRAKMVAEALSDHATDKQLALDALFASLPGGAKGKNAKMSGKNFHALLQKIPELCGRPDLSFTQDQRETILEQFDTDKDGAVSSSEFLDMFRERYICVVASDMSEGVEAGSVVVGKLESGDVVEALQEPQTADASGAVRLHVKALKSGAAGWVTMQTSQGSMHLGHHTVFSSFMRDLDKTLGGAHEKVSEVNSFINQQNLELRDCKQGPLAKAKLELLALRPKVSVAANKLDVLKKKVDGARREHAKREEFDRKKQQEKKERKASSVVLKAIAEKVERVNAALEALEAAAAPLTKAQGSELAGLSTPLTVKKAAGTKVSEARAAIEEARECIKVHNNKLTRASLGPWLQAKQEVARQTGVLDTVAKSVTAMVDKMQAACDNLVAQKVSQVASAIRASLHEKGQTIAALYTELAGKNGTDISAENLSKYLGKMPDLSLPMEQLRMIFDAEGGGGISRLSFFKMLERFCVCVKPIALTADFDIRSSASVRMLDKSEYLEVIEGPTSDEAIGVTRVRARAVKDGKVGWVTVKGNQGTPFLRDTAKPCYYATKSVSIHDTFVVEGANEVGTLRPYDVVEVLEGPEKEVVGSTVRAKVKACTDASVGWLTIRNKQGAVFAEASKVCYTCVAPIALTDVADIKECKVVRKLLKGEVLTVLDGPTSDANSSVTRLRGKSLSDGAEGWVTVKGNAGGVYLEQSMKHYIVTKATALQTAFASARATDVRSLDVEEIVEVMDGPKEEASAPTLRLKGRASSTGIVGWVSVNKMLSPWYPRYKSSGTCALREGMQASAQMLRRLEGGEALEVLEGPAAESGEAPLCVRVRASKDGAIGWVPVVTTDGKPQLENVQAA